MRISDFCFVVAAAAGLTGISLGIFMGIAQDFTLAPAHAHINLLGWVSVALYGLYHRGVERPCQRLAWFQVGAAALGFPMMAGGLAVYLATGTHGLLPLIIVGSVLFLLSMLLFLVVVATDVFRRTRLASIASGPAVRREAAAG